MQINVDLKVANSVSLCFILLTPLVGQVQQKNVNCCGLPVGTIVIRPDSAAARSVNTSSLSRSNPAQRVTMTKPSSVHRSVSKPLPKPIKVYQKRAPSLPPAYRQSSSVARSASSRVGFGSGGVGSRRVPCPPGTRPSDGSFSSVPSPLTVYYVERPIKSIRVSSIPDIERWESGLRKNMALNGRNRVRVNELLARIRDHYQNDEIKAEDYAPAGKGYMPSDTTRQLAENRINRAVMSMAEYYDKSGNREMDPSKSASGNGFLKGKLTFVNTELDKMGQPRITLDELKQAISQRMDGPGPLPERIEAPVNPPEEIAKEVPVLDENAIKQRVKARYLAFAQWLAIKGKAFPSLDPEVDEKTMETFDLVNAELRGIGKFESMLIFREKTIAYLEDVLDGEIVPQPVPQAGPFFAERLRVGLPAEAEDRLEVDTRPELFFRPVREDIPLDFKPSGLPLFSPPALPGYPLDTGPRAKLEGIPGGSFSPASARPLPGKSWTPVRKNAPTHAPIEIRKLGSLPGTPI